MKNCIFMMFFVALLAACGVSFIDEPIQTIAILSATCVALNFHKIIR